MTTEASSGPLRAWTCDTCGEPITDPERALVIWQTSDDHRHYHSFRIVHKSIDGRRCDPGARSGFMMNLDLNYFLGPEGLALLLSWLSAGPLKGGGECRVAAEGMDAYTDLVRRLQLPHYEEARPKFGDEHTRHWLDDANEVYPYLPDVLERVANGILGN